MLKDNHMAYGKNITQQDNSTLKGHISMVSDKDFGYHITPMDNYGLKVLISTDNGMEYSNGIT
jgi:hypothetical protein